MGRHTRGSLFDSGPVAFDAGGLAAVRGEFPHAFDALSAAGATLVSLEPPMWVHDGCEEVADFVRFAEAEIASSGQAPKWARLDNPGAYGVQERFGIPKADADGLRAELEPLNSLVRRLTGSQQGLLEAATGWGETAPVKRYRQGPGDELNEIARIGSDRVLALERVHVDRRRDADDKEGYRDPMRLTLIVSYDEAGGTYFPYAELLQACSGVEQLPTVLDERSTQAGAGGEATWPAEGARDRGVLVRGRRGRLLVFASRSGDPKVPLYSSLHQGVLIQPSASEAAGARPPRMVSVIGACGGGRYETSAFHECLEHETIETRASFWGRTPEQEAMGIYMTQGSSRRGEAWAWLENRAQMRRTTIDELMRQVLLQHPDLADDDAPARLPVAYNDEEDGPDVKPSKIFWRDSCSICLGALLRPSEAAAENALVPGYMSCGHVLCKECHDEIARRMSRGCAVCPECRQFSRCKWRPLIVDGKWVVGDEGVEAGAPAPGSDAELLQPPDPSHANTVEAVTLRRCNSNQWTCTVS